MQGSEKPNPSDAPTLVPVELRRLLPARDSAGLVLAGGGKQFLIMIGPAEAAAVMRELRSEKPERPLTHELIGYILAGFEITVDSVVISSVVNGAYCATLTLKRIQGALTERVRLDVRASDAIVLALKHGVSMHVTRCVLDQVEDISQMISEVDQQLEAGAGEDEPGESAAPESNEPGNPLL